MIQLNSDLPIERLKALDALDRLRMHREELELELEEITRAIDGVIESACLTRHSNVFRNMTVDEINLLINERRLVLERRRSACWHDHENSC